MKKIIALFAMAAAVVGVQAAEINLKVAGMGCEIGCVGKVKQGLTKVKGVDIKGTKFALGTVSSDLIKRFRAAGKPLPMVHSSTYAPDIEPSLRTGVTATTATALDLLVKK